MSGPGSYDWVKGAEKRWKSTIAIMSGGCTSFVVLSALVAGPVGRRDVSADTSFHPQRHPPDHKARDVAPAEYGQGFAFSGVEKIAAQCT